MVVAAATAAAQMCWWLLIPLGYFEQFCESEAFQSHTYISVGVLCGYASLACGVCAGRQGAGRSAVVLPGICQ